MMTSRLSAVFLIVLFASSCQAPEAYRRAQEAFSQGAKVEMRDRFQTLAGERPQELVYLDNLYPSTTAAQAARDAYYELALTEVRTALQGKRQLRKVDALDNTYAIQALSQWRQRDYTAALATAATAIPLLEDQSPDEDDTRDLAMMRALPGLIKLDVAYQQLAVAKTLGEAITVTSNQDSSYQLVRQQFLDYGQANQDGSNSVIRGVALVQSVLEKVENEPNLRRYFLNAQLAGVDTYGDLLLETYQAARRTEQGAEEIAWINQEREAYDRLIATHLERLEKLLPEGRDSALYRFWKRVL
ncbi:MAG: hypothetical protein AAGJ82_12490 [Bacteroidota bacterium]